MMDRSNNGSDERLFCLTWLGLQVHECGLFRRERAQPVNPAAVRTPYFFALLYWQCPATQSLQTIIIRLPGRSGCGRRTAA